MKFDFEIKTLFGKLLSLNLVIILISLTVIGVLFSYLIQNYYYGLKEYEARNNGRRIAKQVSENISGGNIKSNLATTEEKINTIARSSNMNIGLMNETGTIILNAPEMTDRNLALDGREIQQILNGNIITKKLMGPDDENLLMGIPLIQNQDNNIVTIDSQMLEEEINLVGGILIEASLGSIGTTINNILKFVLYSFVVAIIAAIALSIPFTKKITKPLEDIQKSALKSVKGDFQKVKTPTKCSKEIRHLIHTYNYSVTQINETLKKKKRLEKLRKKFVADVSHEFRAPLTSIKGFLELIKNKNISKDKIKEYSEIMYKDTEYLEHLLKDLTDLGQLESKNISLNKEKISPQKLIYRSIETMEKRFQQKDVNIEIELEDNLPEIKVDKNRIHQVLINLLKNAINHAPENSTITVKAQSTSDFKQEESKQKIKFSVIDEGEGIPEEKQEKLWQRFYKVDTARTRQDQNGSGLGLAIVKNIINKHNGNVEVQSQPGNGSTFSFTV